MHIYCILNRVNGKVYLGKSIRNFGIRENEHFKAALDGKTGCTYLFNAIRKYGKKAFEVSLVSGWANSSDDLNAQEKEFIARYRANEPEFGYNLTAGGDGMNAPSPEVRRKMRLAKLGTKQSTETIAKRAKAMVGNQWNKGRIQSDEERAMRSRMSAKPMLGKHHSKETRQKISESITPLVTGENNPFFGKHHSDEVKQKLRETNTGRKHTQEELTKMSQGNTGKKRSEETLKRMSEAAKKRGVSKKHIMRMVEARQKKKLVVQ
jgi:group I intron endonuclease